jgi:hypothetical protein
VYEKLYKVAYETRADGCPVEPSPRVRRVARQALQMCGGPLVSVDDELEPTPTEGPSGAPPAQEPAPLPPPVATQTTPTNKTAESPQSNAAAAPEKSALPTKEEAAPTTANAGDDEKSASALPAFNAGLVSQLGAEDAAPRLPSLNTAASGTVDKTSSASECRACDTKGSLATPTSNPFR